MKINSKDFRVRPREDEANASMFSVVLTAVDGSERSAGVLRAAAEIARRCNGRVHLYRSVTIPQEFPAAARMPLDKLPAILVEEARRELQALASGYPDVVIEEPSMTEPPQAWRGILETGARLDADLIVLGSHGYGGWDRVLGTTAANVVNRAHRNVLVVHDRPLVPGMEVSKGDPG
jgi:nucleotide-binding universal stress UspA family protein